jgi:flagellar basal-body rod modification protein FlgD
MLPGVGSNPAQAGNQAIETPVTTAGASAGGGLLDQTKDRKTAQTDAQFGEIMKQFQAKYGAKAEKPREIKKTLGKDDFLKIMITQMKNQDPTKPFNADEMAAQMAQYASVEQLQNVNQNIQKLATDNKTSQQLSMTAMLGKTVTVDRERFPHTEGQPESLVYNLPKGAAEVKFTILGETGEPILEKDLGPQTQGEQSFSWDGTKANTLPAKNGNYIFKIVAKDSNGMTINMNPKSQGRIIGVSLEGSEPVFLVGDAKHQQKVTLKNITQIDDIPQAPTPSTGMNPAALLSALQGRAPGEGAAPGAQKAAPEVPSNFFGFKKGEGSTNLDPEALSPEQALALAQYQRQMGQTSPAQGPGSAPQAQPRNGAGEQQGFPNGLSDSGDNNNTYSNSRGGGNK